MTTYTVYLPPKDALENQAEDFRLVPDAKAPFAILFPPFWLAWHRLWLPLMAYAVVMVAIFLLAISFPSFALSYLSILPGLYLLLEGYELIRKKLINNGWQYAGIVEASNKEEAEIRFIVASPHLFTKPDFSASGTSSPMRSQSQSALSLFPE